MTVKAILRAKGSYVATTSPETILSTVVWELRVQNIGALVVSEDGTTILGLVSERDIVRGLAEQGAGLLSLSVAQLARQPVVTCTPEDKITAVMARMIRHRVRHVPVVTNEKLCGIVSIGDIVKYRLDELEMEANILREALFSSH
jgi:CBS domain-containing protein